MNRVERQIAFIGMIAMTLGMIHSPAARAADLALSDVPLVIDLGVEPNVVVSLDDSGSMSECRVIISSISEGNAETTFAVMTKIINGLAYDPAVEYQIPIDGNGVSLGEPLFTDAWRNGYNQTSARVDLSAAFTPCWSSLTNNLTSTSIVPAPPLDPAQAAYYYKWIGGVINDAEVVKPSNYTKIVVGSAADASVFDAQAGESNLEKRNFAIWYSYYRNRFIAMRSAANLAFRDPGLGGRIRIAFQGLWGLNGTDSVRTDISLMRPFGAENDSDATAKQGRLDFFNWLNTLSQAGGTPLRYTLDKAGRYYQNLRIGSSAPGHGYTSMNAVDSPWAFQPGTTLSPEFTCRQAFHVLMTDGEWNNDAGRSGNIDSTTSNYGSPGTVALPSGATSYTSKSPYQDANSSSLADNAFYYWINDLRPDLPNDVPAFMPDLTPHPSTNKVEDNPTNDPATWQHMVSFTVGFGVNGTLDPGSVTTYNNLLTGTTSWPATSGAGRVDDLWHAAINSRGTYVSAQNPEELAQGFSNALNAVLARTSSGAAVALNSGTLDANSRLYQARFNSGSWSGQLLAFDINPDGSVATPEAWDAGALLTTRVAGNGWNANRHVITFSGTLGIPFRWASLPSSMQTELNKNGQGIADAPGAEQGQARLEYLRGSAANEGTGNGYRVRAAGKLGDIVNGAPAFVGTPQFNYPDTLETQPYSSFKGANAGRTPVVYAGANDGMLHAFNADSGEELFAYVPKIVFPNLSRLTASPYAHRFFVDGPPTVGDVFYSNAWHTVLVGGLRQGGQGIYALEVTNPGSFSETSANNIARWEFTDADLGYTYSRPAIARMHNGRWAAIVGNGYNNTQADGSASTTGNAALYILDIEDGTVIRKFNTGVGSSADPSGTGRPNGLTTAAPVDVNGDRVVDYIFAGDLFGNVWKFDVRAGDAGLWDIAYNGSALFVALDQFGVRQAITGQMEVGLHPQFQTGSSFFANGGYMIYFGTGKYLETGDNIVTGAQTQSFYGVWDPDRTILPPGFDRSSLLQQQVLEEASATFGTTTFDVRLTSNNLINWRTDPLTPTSGDHLGWYMDLIVQGSGDNRGERQVTVPVLRNGRIIFTTLIPSGSSCIFGGSGFLMELDAANGARLGDPPFDFDNDGTFDLVDFVTIGSAAVPSGIRSTGGAPSAPSILDAGGGEEYKYLSGTDAGKLQAVHEKGGDEPGGGGRRESWRQLR